MKKGKENGGKNRGKALEGRPPQTLGGGMIEIHNISLSLSLRFLYLASGRRTVCNGSTAPQGNASELPNVILTRPASSATRPLHPSGADNSNFPTVLSPSPSPLQQSTLRARAGW